MSLVLIVADSLRHDALGCGGAGNGVTPHRLAAPARTPTIDGLAAEGVVFERVVSAAPWTVPSIASMFSGMFAHRLGLAQWQQPFPAECPTLFEGARRAGLLVASFVFDTGHLFCRVPEAGVRASSQDIPALLNWMDAHRDVEYFLFIHYWWTHVPYIAHPMSPREWRQLSERVLRGLRTGAAAREGVKRLYLRAVERFSEDFVPRVLERADLARTWVVITADHGESWGERLETAALRDVFDLHGNTLYEELLRVPLVIRSPRGGPARRVTDLIRTVDLAPTLAGLLGWGGPPDPNIDGVDLSDCIRSGAAPPKLTGISVMNRDFIEAPDLPRDPGELYHGWALTSARYKLIHDAMTRQRVVFDLSEDPGETSPLGETPGDGELAAGWRELERQRRRARVRPVADAEVDALEQQLRELGYLG